MPSKDKHQDDLIDAIASAMNVYLRKHNGVHVDVVQAALGSILTETFEKVSGHEQRMHLLNSFCAILRESVEDIEREQDDADDEVTIDADIPPKRTLQ